MNLAERYKGPICFPHCIVKYTNLSPTGISGRGKTGNGRVGFMTCKYYSCLENVEYTV